jgi:hypothetical protein
VKGRKTIEVFSISFIDVLAGALGAVIILHILIPQLSIPVEEFEEQQRVLEEVEKMNLEIEDLQARVPKNLIEELEVQLEAIQKAREQVEREIKMKHHILQNENSELRKKKEIIDKLNLHLNSLERDIQKCEEDLESLMSEGTYILVTIAWKTLKHDVDLHIKTPWGDEFFYKKKSFRNRPGELTLDDKRGPGLEVWSIMNPPSGVYKVYAKLFARHGNPGNAMPKIEIIHRNGSKTYDSILLTREGGDEYENKEFLCDIVVPNNGLLLIR